MTRKAPACTAEQRAPPRPKIHGANGRRSATSCAALEMYVPAGTRQLISMRPAGASGLLLQEMLSRADSIIIRWRLRRSDIHATAISSSTCSHGRIRWRNIRLAVVANRVRKSSPCINRSSVFSARSALPLIAPLSDSDAYLKAAEMGLGIFEMDFSMFVRSSASSSHRS